MLFFTFVLVGLIGLVNARVIDIVDATFDQYVGGEKAALVEFFAPWCGHCKNLAPEWKIAGETMQESDGIVIAAVDATESQALAARFGVQGYPTIKYFAPHSTTPEEYDGGRSADTIVSWINDKIGTNRRVKQAPTAVTVLGSDNFDGVALNPAKVTFVKFYAPWCGHCKSLAPKWEELATAFAGDENVIISKVDVTEHEELGSRYDISGFPTLKLFKARGSEVAIDSYEGPRELDQLVEYVNKHAGTHRQSDGSLSGAAGRVATLDAIVTEAGGDMSVILEKFSAVEVSDKDKASHDVYVAVANKIQAKGTDYIRTEGVRLAKMVAGTAVSPTKKTTMMIKINILDAFA